MYIPADNNNNMCFRFDTVIINMATIDIILRPRCALPSPPSWPMGRIACAQNFPEFYLRLPDVIGDWMIPFATNTAATLLYFLRPPKKKCPPLGDWVLRLTHGTYGLPQSSSQTASRSVQPFLYGPKCCCTMYCQRRIKHLKTAPFPWDFVTLSEEDQATAISNRHGKISKDLACGFGDIFADRQTDRHTDRRAHHSTSPPLPRAK